MDIKPLGNGWREQVRRFISRNWGSPLIVARGRILEPALLPGFVQAREGKLPP